MFDARRGAAAATTYKKHHRPRRIDGIFFLLLFMIFFFFLYDLYRFRRININLRFAAPFCYYRRAYSDGF